MTTATQLDKLAEAATVFTACGLPIIGEAGIDVDVAKAAKPFTDWLKEVDQERFPIKWIYVQSVDMFGPRVGFIKFKVRLKNVDDKVPPSIIFARGGSVANIVVLVCEGKAHVVCTVQPRLATGDFNFVEVCAGMLDGSGDFAGTAARELKEELDLEIHKDDLTNLSELSGNPGGVFLSPGACDETMRFFAFCRTVSREELDVMEGKCTGLLEEGESITLKIVELDSLVAIPDAKTMIAHSLFERFKDKIPGTEAIDQRVLYPRPGLEPVKIA